MLRPIPLAALILLAAAVGLGHADEMIRLQDRGLLSRHNILVQHDSLVSHLRHLIEAEASTKRASEIIGDLGAQTYAKRHAAFEELRDIGVPATPILKSALQSKDSEVRERVARLLEMVERKDVESVVVACIRELEPMKIERFVELAMGTLHAIEPGYASQEITRIIVRNVGRSDLPFIKKHLTHWNENVRCAALRAFARLDQTDESTATFKSLVDEPSERVRAIVAAVLAERRHRVGFAILVGLLEHHDGEICKQAFDDLQRLANRNLGYLPYGLATKRVDSVRKWKSWLAKLPDPVKGPTAEEPSKREFQILLSVSNGGVSICLADGSTPIKIPISAYDAQLLADGRIVIAGRSAGRISVVNQDGKVLRTIEGLGAPSDVEYLPNGNILVLENEGGKVSEFNAKGHRVWEVGGLNNPFDVDRLPNGNTLIADSGNGRLVEFRPDGQIAWEKQDVGFANNVVRLRNGNTAYTTYTAGEVLVISPDGRMLHEAKVKGATLYAVQEMGGSIVVGDGAGKQVVWFDQQCKKQKTVSVPHRFTDAFFYE